MEAFANLATTSASDKSTISTLTSTNAILTTTNATLVKEIFFLRKEIHALCEAGSDTGHRKYYYWLCGTFLSYSSHKYNAKKDRYKNRATTINKIGRETRHLEFSCSNSIETFSIERDSMVWLFPWRRIFVNATSEFGN